jgi:hypothetical protein
MNANSGRAARALLRIQLAIAEYGSVRLMVNGEVVPVSNDTPDRALEYLAGQMALKGGGILTW